MKFTAEKPKLIAALRAALSVIGRSHAPILECVKITAKDNTVQLLGASATCHTFCAARCEAAVAIAGECAVSAKDLLATLNPCRETALEITFNGSAFVISAKGTRIEIPTISQEFPKPRKPDALVECEGAESAISFCNGFNAKDDSREYLNGVRLEAQSCVSMDANIMSIHPIEYSGEPSIIAAQDVALVAKEIKAGARLFASQSAWQTEREGVKMTGATLEHRSVPWETLEHSEAASAECDADDLLASIEMVSAGRSHSVCLDISSDQISLKGESFDGFSVNASTQVRCEGNLRANITFSTAYLRQSLRALSGGVVKIQAMSGKPIRFTSTSDPLARIYLMNKKHPETVIPEAA